MSSGNGGHIRRQKKCSVCDLAPLIIEEIDTRMSAGQRNADITRWMRTANHRPPTATMLNRHRDDGHYRGDRTIVQTSDSLIASGHRDGLNLMQRVQLNVAHTLLPRLALAPKTLNVLEEMQELYVFTKNQLAIDFEIAQNTPEIYEHPVTGETQLITPTSPNMLRLVKEMRQQLRDIDESAKNVQKIDDLSAEFSISLMAAIQAKDEKLQEIQDYLHQTTEIIDAEAVDVTDDD